MPTYDPRSVTLTIGGVPFEGFTEVEYRDPPERVVVGTDGRTKGRVVTRGSVTLSGPALDQLADALGLARWRPLSPREQRVRALRASLAALIAEPPLPLP